MLWFMQKMWVFALFLSLLGLSSSEEALLTNTPDSAIPPGFSLAISDSGTTLYSKENQNEEVDYVLVADLSQGAYLSLLHGEISNPGTGKGVYGGDSPTFARQILKEVWADFSSSYPKAFCITNGQFFSTKDNPTQFSFPLKADGKIISEGSEIRNPDHNLILEIWGDKANIGPLTRETLYSSSAPNIIAGLSEQANKEMNNRVGRTFVGIDDNNGDGKFEIILIFNSAKATQQEATTVLRSFGADKVMMLDGGGSTQLICRGKTYVPSKDSRKIPQTLVVNSKIPDSTDDNDGIKETIQQMIEKWLTDLKEKWDEFWKEQQKKLADWWEKQMQNLEKQLQDWWKKQQQQLEKWLEQQLQKLSKQLAKQFEQMLLECCGSLAFPAGAVILIGIKRWQHK